MRRSLIASAFAIAILAAPVAHAVQPDEIMADPAREARARDLSRELRCMVCQNQSIDDSEAPLARDLRLLVRERISAGDSDSQVIDFLVARYGEFVLLKPRFNPHTFLLWLVPPLALLGGGFALWHYGRRRVSSSDSTDDSTVKLTAEEEARLERLMAAQPAGDQPDQGRGLTP
jgi:cytochrome c-type biogenesis protein CcmH